MTFYVGTSGYGYKEWKGKFYPRDLPADRMLAYYAGRFAAVEINHTFRRMPEASVLAGWAKQVPAGFRLVLKAPQRITHIKRLKDAGEPLAEFLATATTLKRRLGPLFFQLPPNMKKDRPRLETFLKLLPRGRRAAFEFRHPSWFDDEVFDLLRKRNAALCIADADDELHVPLVATADWGYLRLRRAAYPPAALKAWAKRIKKQDWGDVFVFFKHEEQATGPAFATALMKQLG